MMARERTGGRGAAALTLLGGAALVLLGGCLSTSRSATLRIVGSDRLNQNDHEESNSVRLRIFKLRFPMKFEKASREELWRLDGAREKLGDSLVGEIDERHFSVGDPAMSISFQNLDPAVKWIGLMLLCYNDKEGKGTWRETLKVEDLGSFTFRLRDYSIKREDR